MNIRKIFLFIALFLSAFGIYSFSYAQGGDDPIPGIDIIIKENCGPNGDQICGHIPVHLYRCEDGTVVTNSTDCGGQISMVKYMKIDGIDGEVQDKIAAAGEAMWLCDNGDIVGRPQDCKDDLDTLPALLITEETYIKLIEEAKAAIFLCSDGTTAVSRLSDCPDDIDIDSSDATTISPHNWYRCEDGTVIEFGESCPPTIMKAQAEKIDGIDGEGIAGDDSDDATTKQGGNDPVPGIDVIIKRETVAAPSTLYRCEDGTVVEDSADCGPQIGMVKYIKTNGKIIGENNIDAINTLKANDYERGTTVGLSIDFINNDGNSDGLDRVVETVTLNIRNSVHICDDGSQVSLPSECDDNSQYDTIVYVPADEFHKIQGISRGFPCYDGTIVNDPDDCKDILPVQEEAMKIDGIEGESLAGDDSDDATTKQGGNDPIEGIDIITKKCKPYPECDKTVVGDPNLSPEEIKAEKRKAQRVLYRVKEVSVNKYKKRFNSKLKRVLPKIPEKKFDEILERIDAMLERTENNTKLSDKKRETLLSAILAIKEIIEDGIGGEMDLGGGATLK